MSPTTQAADPTSLFSASGLVIAITGGGTGIGLALATALHRTSARKIYLLGRRESVLTSAASGLDPSLTTVVPLVCDVTSLPSIRRAAARVEQDAGHLDVLVNNAGREGPHTKAAFEAQTIEDVQRVLLAGFGDGGEEGGEEAFKETLFTNAATVVSVSAAFLPLLDAGNRRRGWQGGRVAPDAARQRISPAEETGVEEGDLRTSQIVSVASIAAFNRYATFPISQVPAGRQGTPDEIAAAVLYLVGKGGAYVTGAVQLTDGGRLCGMPSTY
ncbi:hypothetical protein SLS57_003579 [Botryosphaeria dothidea]